LRTRTVEIDGNLVEIERSQHIWRKDGGKPRLVQNISLREDGRRFRKRLCVAEYIIIKYHGVILYPALVDGVNKYYLAVDLPDLPGDIEDESAYLHQAVKDYDYMIRNKIPLPK
jgi:hypothetical protein